MISVDEFITVICTDWNRDDRCPDVETTCTTTVTRGEMISVDEVIRVICTDWNREGRCPDFKTTCTITVTRGEMTRIITILHRMEMVVTALMAIEFANIDFLRCRRCRYALRKNKSSCNH